MRIFLATFFALVLAFLPFDPPDTADGATTTAVIELEGSSRDAQNLPILTERSSGLRHVQELTRSGIAPEGVKILISKGTVASFETFQHVAARFILAASPGPTDVDPSKFTYTRARQPLKGLGDR